jgi:glycosyltransferase involved in cell wall biosynthesis
VICRNSAIDQMKILMLNHNIAWQGTYFRCFHLARHLVRRGHRVTILTMRKDLALTPRCTVEAGVEVVETPREIGRFPYRYWHRWMAPGVFWRLFWILRESHDVVMAFAHWPVVACPFFLAKLKRERKLVADWDDLFTDGGIFESKWPRESIAYRLENWLERRTKCMADSVTVASQDLHQRALSFGIAPDRLRYLPNGADTENIRPYSKEQARRQLGLPLEARIIGYTGVTTSQEVRLLIEAFVSIAAQVPQAHLLLLGPFENGRYQEGIDAAIRRRIITPGPVPYANLGMYLAAADLLALPLPDVPNSRARWPIKLGDYLAAGRPIVATALGDLVPIFKEHAIGLTAVPGTEDFARKAIEMLNDPDRSEKCGQMARQVAEKSLDWGILAGQLEAFLQSS